MRTVLAIVLGTATAFAQAPAAPSFEVAAIRDWINAGAP